MTRAEVAYMHNPFNLIGVGVSRRSVEASERRSLHMCLRSRAFEAAAAMGGELTLRRLLRFLAVRVFK